MNATWLWPREIRRKATLGAYATILVMGLFLSLGSVQAAEANSKAFCTSFTAETKNERCHSTFVSNLFDVQVTSGAHNACASALADNAGEPGGEVGPIVCTSNPHETAGNTNYNGKTLLFALISNDGTSENTISGEAFFT